jgi:hypothetical protein
VEKSLDAGVSSPVGLKIGDSPEVRANLEMNVPGGELTDAGRVTVGPIVTVRLEADPSEAEITPKESYPMLPKKGDNGAMAFSWNVRPKVVTDRLNLIAIVEASKSEPGSKPTTSTKSLFIQTNRTLKFTVEQIFGSWGTWAAIGGVVLVAFRRTRDLLAIPFKKEARASAPEKAPEKQAESQDAEHDLTGYL